MSEFRTEPVDSAYIDTDPLVARRPWENIRQAAAAVLGRVGVAGVRGVHFVRGAAEGFIFNPGMSATMPDWVLGSHIAHRACGPIEAHAQRLVDIASNMGFQPPESIAAYRLQKAEASVPAVIMGAEPDA